MNNLSANLPVKFYDGDTPVGETATAIYAGPSLRIVGARTTREYPIRSIRVSPRIGNSERFIALPDGAQLQCPDHPLLDRLPQDVNSEGLIAWLERRWWVALACLGICVAGVAVGYVVALPSAAERIADAIPIEQERLLGDQALKWLDQSGMFAVSSLSDETRQPIVDGFARIADGLPLSEHYQLEFRNSPKVGPNAFALPGGIIVVTDQMVKLGESPDEVLAVLAHEIGHVEGRHALRHLLQDSAVAALAASIVGDASSLTLLVSGLPALLAQAKYSREFETEADEFAFELLKHHNLSPALFASVMERLRNDADKELEKKLSFLSTHPVTDERIARAREAAAELESSDDEEAAPDDDPGAPAPEATP